MPCGAESPRLLPGCCCPELGDCQLAPYCLYSAGTSEHFRVSSGTVGWPTDAIGAECSVWGHGGDGGGGGTGASGGGAGGSYMNILLQRGADDHFQVIINDNANDQHTDVVMDGTLIFRMWRSMNGFPGPNGWGGWHSLDPPFGVPYISDVSYLPACLLLGGYGADGDDTKEKGGGGGGGAGEDGPGVDGYQNFGGPGGQPNGGKGGDGTPATGEPGTIITGGGAGGYNGTAGGPGAAAKFGYRFLYPVTLKANVAGAPAAIECTCEIPDGGTTLIRVDLSVLNDSYDCVQRAPFGATFDKVFLPTPLTADGIRANCPLVQFNKHTPEVGTAGSYEIELRMVAFEIALGCVDNRMVITSIGWSFYSGQRDIFVDGGDWTGWTFFPYLAGYPRIGGPLICDGTWLTVDGAAPPCKKDTGMTSEFKWCDVYVGDPCSTNPIIFDCTVGQQGSVHASINK